MQLPWTRCHSLNVSATRWGDCPGIETPGYNALGGDGGADVRPIPGRPFRGPDAPAQAYAHLERFHRGAPKVASNRLHRIKESGELGPSDRVVIGRTGDVYDESTGMRLGSLTNPIWG